MTRNRCEYLIGAVSVLCALLLVFSIPAWAQSPDSNETPESGPAQEYTIGVSDLLSVSVWNQDALQVTIPVRPDGRITVPLLGEVDVVGRRPEQVQAELTRGYEEFVAAPAVSLVVTEINSRRIYVLGEVGDPGVFDILTPTTVLQALAMAGGFTEFAKKDAVVVVRERGGTSQRLEVSVKEITSGKNLDDNLQLLPGDTIYVP